MYTVGFDIETIPTALDTPAWERYRFHNDKPESAAAVHPAFAQVVSVAFSIGTTGKPDRYRNHCGTDEVKVLTYAANILNSLSNANTLLVGHCILRFDIPIMVARYIKHKMAVPPLLLTYGKKPWELTWIADTSLMLKPDSWLSLDALCLICNVASPKQGVDGSNVWDLVKEGKLEEVAAYNLLDSTAVLECYRVLADAYK